MEIKFDIIPRPNKPQGLYDSHANSDLDKIRGVAGKKTVHDLCKASTPSGIIIGSKIPDLNVFPVGKVKKGTISKRNAKVLPKYIEN